jgi:AraC-binding-like domain
MNPRPLERFPLVRTQDTEELCAALGRVYAEPKLSLDRGVRRIDVSINHLQLDDIGIGYTKYGQGVAAAFPGNNFALQVFPIQGLGQLTIGSEDHPLDRYHGTTVSPGIQFAIKFNIDYEHLVLVVRPAALASKLEALTGVSVKSPLRFNGTQDYRHPAAKALRDHFFFLVKELNNAMIGLPKVALAEFEQTLIVMFLHANRHNFSHELERSAPSAALNQVRRAEEYIEANVDRALTLEDLADVAGVSVFSLCAAFKKYRGDLPLSFLARVRARRQATGC